MRLRVLAVAAILVWTTSSANAQEPAPCVAAIGGSIDYGINPIKNAPFSAVVKTTFEQKLVDGNAIHSVSQTRRARDSAGRTMTETAQGCERTQDGQSHPRLNINVNDPVAKTLSNWQTGDLGPKVVHVFHTDPVPRPAPPQQQVDLARLARIQPARNQIKTEKLGTRTINGIETVGSRTTQTIPAGQEGNDLPLVIVTETWRSQTLGIVLMATRDDPRHGKSTFEYTEFNLGEPDARDFSLPADYKVQEVHPNLTEAQ